MKDNREAIKNAFETYMLKAEEFWGKGIKRAAAEARAALLDIKNLAHAERTAIQDAKNAASTSAKPVAKTAKASAKAKK